MRQSSGSYTLEASMLMPVLMIVTFLLVLYALFMTQHVIIRYKSSIATERAAFNWGHADSDYATGAYEPGRYEGLYWRLTDDGLLKGLFGWTSDESADTLNYPGAADPGDRPTLRRLYPAAESLGLYWKGSIGYRHGGLKREIEAAAADPGELAPLSALRGSAAVSAASSSPVTEPAEWIRTFDLVRYYMARADREGSGAKGYLDKAGALLGRRGG